MAGLGKAGWSLALHGGAGTIERRHMAPSTEARLRAGLGAALAAGTELLERGGAALDAVEAAVRTLEENPDFNAARGAVFTAEGRNELDASIMDGREMRAGAVAGLTRTKSPIGAARAVMERSPHVLLIHEGAERFARDQGLEEVSPGWFWTERRWSQLEHALRAMGLPAPPRPEYSPPPGTPEPDGPPDELKFSTVGAAGLDRNGNLAAGTSTGGITAKRYGRVGDSCIIGAGTYAENGVAALSATGNGEFFIRLGVTRMICARMQLKGESAQTAADRIVKTELVRIGGAGGVIGVDGRGRPFWSYNTPGMYRARQSAGGKPLVAIYGDEP